MNVITGADKSFVLINQEVPITRAIRHVSSCSPYSEFTFKAIVTYAVYEYLVSTFDTGRPVTWKVVSASANAYTFVGYVWILVSSGIGVDETGVVDVTVRVYGREANP